MINSLRKRVTQCKVCVHRSYARIAVDDLQTHRDVFDRIGARLNVNRLNLWYNVGYVDAVDAGAGGILKKHNHSLATCLGILYPDHAWLPWKFRSVRFFIEFRIILNAIIFSLSYNLFTPSRQAPKEYWQSLRNQRERFESIGASLNVRHLDDWYNVRKEDVIAAGASGLLAYYNGSLSACLGVLYPNKSWVLWKFVSVPKHYWKDLNNQRALVASLEESWRMKSLDDWYKQSSHYLGQLDKSLRSLMALYGNLPQLLRALYPSFEWRNDKFYLKPMGFWTNTGNRKKFLKEMIKEYHIEKPDDWYTLGISEATLKKGGHGLRKYWPHVLRLVAPRFDWDWSRFARTGKASTQRRLAHTIRKLLPWLDVREEFLLGLRCASAQRVSLDIFIPEYNLALEYQGEHHYQDSFRRRGHFSNVQHALDVEKAALCAEAGIRLVDFPYWYGTSARSVSLLLQKIEPGLFSGSQDGPSTALRQYLNTSKELKRSSSRHVMLPFDVKRAL